MHTLDPIADSRYLVPHDSLPLAFLRPVAATLSLQNGAEPHVSLRVVIRAFVCATSSPFAFSNFI